MPPAVAQAPMVTSNGVSRRMRTISSACSGVLTEPSTRTMSYGPDERWSRCLRELDEVEPPEDVEEVVLEVEQRQLAPVAGRHLHDPRAVVAARGRLERRRLITGLPVRTPARARRARRPVRPGRRTPSRAGSGRTGPTPHSMCRSSVRWMRSSVMPRSRRTSTVASIIRSGPQMNAVAPAPSQVARSNSSVTTPTRPSHSGPARSTVCPTSTSGAPLEARELVHEQPVGRGPGAVHEPDGPEPIALGEDRVDQRAQRRQADAAGHDDDVTAVRGLDRPAATEGATDAERVAPPERAQRARRGPRGADRQLEAVGR